jgi:cytochrome c oxidase subunit II
MKPIILALGIAFLAGCAGTPVDPLQGMAAGAPVQKIAMTAEKYKFTPEVVRIPQGTHVILEIESLDVTHGLAIGQYGINVQLPPHQKVTAEFYAKDAGTFGFKCSHLCGLGHIGMTGQVVVEPAGKP